METFLFVGMCRFAATFATDLDVHLKEIADQMSANGRKSNLIKRIELVQKFKALLRFQGDSKQ